MLLGPAIISSAQPWPAYRAIINAMRPEIIRVRTPEGFGFSPAQLHDVLADNPGLQMVAFGTEDLIVGPQQVAKEIAGRGFLSLVDQFPFVEFVIELGNEPFDDPNHSIWSHRGDLIHTLTTLTSEWARPNLKWAVGLPTTLPLVIDLLARDQWGCVLDYADYLCPHWYGWRLIGDGAGDDGKWNDIMHYLYTRTTLPLLVTEVGIDDRDTPLPEKARRYLDWAAHAHPRIRGACLWGVGEWRGPGRNETMELTMEQATLLGARPLVVPEPEPQPPPRPEPPKEEPMPLHDRPLTLADPWFGTDDLTSAEIKRTFLAQGAPDDQQLAQFVDSLVYRTHEFGLLTKAVAGQVAVETNWLRFGGQVAKKQNNFGGIGADDGGAAGAVNPTVDYGVVQVCVHHLAYLLGLPDQWPEHLRQYAHTDDRIDDVQSLLKARGLLENRPALIQDYGGGIWATDPNYKYKIIERANLIWAGRTKEQEPLMGAQIPGFIWKPARDDHYDQGRSGKVRGGAQHYTGGTNSLDWLTFSSQPDPVSAHFLVRRNATMDNRGWQLVDMRDTAWTNWYANPYTITIEYEHLASQDIPEGDYEVMAQTWVDIIRWLEENPEVGSIRAEVSAFGIQGHKAWTPESGTACPDGIDVNRIVSRVREILDGTPSEPLPDPNTWFFVETGHWVINLPEAPMLDFYRTEGAWEKLGYPLSGMWLRDDGAHIQFFENVLLEIYPDGTRRFGGLGQRLFQLRAAYQVTEDLA